MSSLFHTASALTLGMAEGKDQKMKEGLDRVEFLWDRKTRDSKYFHQGRDGDHILVPFECDLCIFRKLRKVDPSSEIEQDNLLLECIRSSNLDAFWSRARSTVLQNKRMVKSLLDLSELVELTGSYEHEAP